MSNREEWLISKVTELEQRLTVLSTIVGQHEGFLKVIGYGMGIIGTCAVTLIINMLSK